MLRAMTILVAGALCAPAFGASVTTLTDDYETGSMTRITIVYTPEELGLQARDLVPLPGMTAKDWEEALELEAGMPYWQTWQEVEALARPLFLSQGWNDDNYMGSDFNPATGELKLFITDWTGESPWDYHNRTGISPWGGPSSVSDEGAFEYPLARFEPGLAISLPLFETAAALAESPAAVPSPSALTAGLAIAIAGTLRRRR